MKKRMLSALLALCMMLTMVPAAFAADGNSGSEITSAQELQDALDNAASNQSGNKTVTLTQDIGVSNSGVSATKKSAVIKIPEGVTLDGKGYRIYALSEDTNWVTTNNEPTNHIISVEGASENTTTTIKNLTIEGHAGTKSGIHAYNCKGTVALESVTIKNCGNAAVQVNGATVTATNLTTEDNVWGAVNVDQGENVTTTASFTLTGDNNSLGEPVKIWTELTNQENVITVPEDWVQVDGNGNNAYAPVESLTENVIHNETQGKYYQSLDLAVEKAAAGDIITLAAGEYELAANEYINLNKKITIQGTGEETIIKGSSTQDYNNGLLTFVGGSEGSVIKDLTIEYTSSGAQNAAVYFGYGFDGGSADNVTKIQNVDFKGSDNLDSEKAIAISSTYIKGGFIEITGCSIENFAYGMYFNGIHDLTVADNTIDGTKYNAINIAADNEEYACSDITISDNILTNISTADYGDDTYSSGINLGKSSSDVMLENNSITMSSDAPAVNIYKGDGETSNVVATFDYGDYEGAPENTVYVVAKDTKVKMPAAERTGYTLEGWEDNLTSTVYKIGTDVVINADVTFTAQWDRNSSSGGGGGSGSSSYAVSVSSVSNGSVTVSPKNASKGATVTITVAPNEGYELGSLTVTDANGNRISLTNAGDGKYTFTMPSSKVTVTATFTAVEEIPGQVGSFTDVNTDDWFAEAVQYMLDNEMMNGTSATTFGPNTTTTRGMIVTILYRLEGEPDAAASSFTDVASNMYYADAINWAAANGIVNGITTTTFGPDNAITREQMAAILYRYAQYKGYDVTASNDLGSYTDASQISAYATTAMQWANAEGLITGNTTTTINPTGNATRAEVATILMRFCENIAG